ncbi:MAG TPA: site-2 protease family protein [Blastocatellia bacterium]|nr:site-2 protease family protein [Blastocatellia bacterium]
MKFNPNPIHLCRIFGIPIQAHYSWLPVIPFYTWAMASAFLPRQVPGLPRLEYWALGFITTALLFLSVLAHELAHAMMARAEGLGTGNITLYMFGGLATLEGQVAYPSSEFKIAVVGPAASFLLGLFFLAADQLLLYGTPYRAAGQVLRHMGVINWFLAGMNILPGLPLDGGRVLRAILWHFNKNFRAATNAAIRSGAIIAVALVGLGVSSFMFQEWVTGMWAVIVGLLIALMLATTEGRNRGAWRVKRGTVEDVLAPDVVLVPPDMKLAEFVHKVLANNRDISFAVARDRRLHGMLILEELKSVPPSDWPHLEARQVMRPVDDSMFISSEMRLNDANRFLTARGLARVIVVDRNGLILGDVSLRNVRKALSDGAGQRTNERDGRRETSGG